MKYSKGLMSRIMQYYKHLKTWICCSYVVVSLLIPIASYASYIETTMGTAVVNDATAAYYNPAALILLKNPQIIPLVNVARFRSQFSGQSTSVLTQFSQSGTSSSISNYNSPSFYAGMPANKWLFLGFAAVTNFANRNPEEQSILRYTQSGNSIQDYNYVPALGIKINDYLSLGINANYSRLNFNLHPLIGFPGTNIADSQSNNQSVGNGIGADIGVLLKLGTTTLVGLNYRSVTKYNESGSSELHGITSVNSSNYHFILRTPARTTLTISQALTTAVRLMTTLQRIQWSIIRNINVYNIATIAGITPAIVNATIPQYLKNTWAFTLGGQYQFLPRWILRVAATYNQTPDSGYYQVSTGNSLIVGTSIGYEINKIIKIDGSYAHVFLQNQTIDINGNRFLIKGINKGSRDAVSVKLTLNLL